MRLARKLTLALVLGILVVLAGNAVFRVRREIQLFESDSQRDSLLMGRVLAGAVERVWPSLGEEQALDVVEDANQRESTVRIRLVWMEAGAGAPGGPEVDPREAGATRLPGGETVIRAPLDPDGTDALYAYVPLAVRRPPRRHRGA
jgi:hypothetical protein